MFARTIVFITIVVSDATCARCNDSAGGTSNANADGASVTTSQRTSSCDRVPAMSVCSEYSGAYLAQNEAVLSSACGKLGGTFVGAECPNSAVLGSCTLSTGEVRKFYASGGAPYDIARAQTECEGPYRGKWAPLR